MLNAAFEIYQPTLPRELLIRIVEHFFSAKAVIVPDGLAELPSCWLHNLAPLLWHSRKPHWETLPYMIDSLGIENGILWLAFAQELPTEATQLTRWDELRIMLNSDLKPNIWHPLTREQEREIWRLRPELRGELFQLIN